MKFNSVLLTDLDELKKISKDWNVLAKHALEDNINYEPRPLLSLLSNIRYANWCVLTLWCEKQLVGFFPLQQVQTYRVPIQQYTTLFENHFHVMSCVPLVHIDYAKEVVRSYLDWLNTGDAKLFHINEIVQGSAYGDLLQKELADARLVVSHVQTSDRAAVTATRYSPTPPMALQMSAQTEASATPPT